MEHRGIYLARVVVYQSKVMYSVCLFEGKEGNCSDEVSGTLCQILVGRHKEIIILRESAENLPLAGKMRHRFRNRR